MRNQLLLEQKKAKVSDQRAIGELRIAGGIDGLMARVERQLLLMIPIASQKKN